MKFIDNINDTVKNDLEITIAKGSRISISSSYFSIFAFEALKKELQEIVELRFIFTSPTFTSEKAIKEKREFYIPRLGRERSLYGTAFEVKLRNRRQPSLETLFEIAKILNVDSKDLIDSKDNKYVEKL